MERARVVAKRERARAAEDDDVADGGGVAQRRLERLAVVKRSCSSRSAWMLPRSGRPRARCCGSDRQNRPAFSAWARRWAVSGDTTRSTKRTPRRSATAGATSLPPEPYDAETVTTGIAAS